MRDIENQQILIFNKIKKIYKNFTKEKFHPNYDTPIYFNSSHNYSFGLIQMKKFMGKDENFFSKLFILLKDFSYSMFINNSKFENIKLDENFNKIIVTWAFKKNFKSDGSLNDRYFNYNSKSSKDIFWFVIYMDNDLPKKVGNNILIYRIFNQKKFNFLALIEILKKNINYFFKNIDYFLFSISNLNFISRNIVNCFENLLSKNIKTILIPYEGQPFQNGIIKCAKEKYGINTIGYIHAPPLAFPSNYVKKKFSPNKIFVNGLDQKAVFSRIGWNKKDIKICNSLRFLKQKTNFKYKIFLPITIKSENSILRGIYHLTDFLKYDLSKYDVKIHPAALKSKKCINLKKKILIRIKNSKNNKKQNPNYPIFVGASGSIIEALERGYRVLHICEIPIIDCYSKKIWNSLTSEKIATNIFLYKIKKQGNIIKLGNKPKNLNVFFKK
ncbi:MAG: hypothetical protein CMI79_02500 [Candidatus Pelagibacter sp.]|nr:hypothetical protein [Candidatus Pelagibacter sp.]|tara:strand:- start:6426 stop:7751 length:1326 start_codon:yes stop_codon:yes gene_type:complete